MNKRFSGNLSQDTALEMWGHELIDYCSRNSEISTVCQDDYFWMLKFDHDFAEHTKNSTLTPSEYTLLYDKSHGLWRNTYIKWLNEPEINLNDPILSYPFYTYITMFRLNTPRDIIYGIGNLALAYNDSAVIDKLYKFDPKLSFPNLYYYYDQNWTFMDTISLENIKWMVYTLDINYIKIFDAALRSGRIDILEWIDKTYNMELNHKDTIAAMVFKRLDVLQWLANQGILPEPEDIKTAMDIVILSPEIQQWLRDLGFNYI